MRRLFWMAAGATISTVATRWTKRKATELAEHYKPGTVGKRIASNVNERVDAVVSDHKAAVDATERRLRKPRRRPSRTAEEPGTGAPNNEQTATAGDARQPSDQPRVHL